MSAGGKSRATQKRYVFLETFSQRIRQLSISEFGDLKMYRRFSQGIVRGLYNIVTIYGLPAIDIDDPQDVVVSVRLKFSVEKEAGTCSFRSVRELD